MSLQPDVSLLDPRLTESSMLLAESALQKLRGLKLNPIPPNYEILFAYCVGSNPSLNRDINAIVESTGSIDQSELERMGALHLPAMRATDRHRQVAADFGEQLREFVNMLNDALGRTSSHTQTLSNTAGLLDGSPTDIDLVKQVLGTLAAVAREIRQSNELLNDNLQQSKRQVIVLQRALEAVREESQTDSLTGVGNRKRFDAAAAAAIASAAETNEPLSLLLFDIDHFKSFNDRFGHSTGDQVLKLVAHVARQRTKGNDLVARTGGEEFAVLLPNTRLQQAISVAEYIRRAIMAIELKKKSTGERLGRITISVGAAVMSKADSRESLFERADRHLYEAKRSGRNRVCGESRSEPGLLA